MRWQHVDQAARQGALRRAEPARSRVRVGQRVDQRQMSLSSMRRLISAASVVLSASTDWNLHLLCIHLVVRVLPKLLNNMVASIKCLLKHSAIAGTCNAFT